MVDAEQNTHYASHDYWTGKKKKEKKKREENQRKERKNKTERESK